MIDIAKIKKPRSARELGHRLIDKDLLETADQMLKQARRNVNLTPRPRSRTRFIAAVHNLILIGSIRSQQDLDAWLVKTFKGEQ